jgi:hypothetical protein
LIRIKLWQIGAIGALALSVLPISNGRNDPLGQAMDRFIARENIKHFRDRLGSETNPDTRALLQRLLVQEEDKLGLDTALLAEVERAITNFDALIATQRKLVAVLKRDGGNGIARAESLLDGLKSSQILHREYHHKMLRVFNQNSV